MWVCGGERKMRGGGGKARKARGHVWSLSYGNEAGASKGRCAEPPGQDEALTGDLLSSLVIDFIPQGGACSPSLRCPPLTSYTGLHNLFFLPCCLGSSFSIYFLGRTWSLGLFFGLATHVNLLQKADRPRKQVWTATIKLWLSLLLRILNPPFQVMPSYWARNLQLTFCCIL